MGKVKKIIGKVLVIVLACLMVSTVVSAEESATADVQIEIEASEVVKDEEAPEKNEEETIPGPSEGENTPGQNEGETTPENKEDGNTSDEKVEVIQTGDTMTLIPYFCAIAIAIGIVAVCVWKKKKNGMFAVFALLLSLFLINEPVYAAETSENISVTIPTSISISFDATGENSISEFVVENQSVVPITIEKINATECNDWNLVKKGSEIPADTKKIAFEIAGNCLVAGENTVNMPIEENTREAMNINVERGAWTNANAKETALQLEFEYAIGQREFQLHFDTNGSNETIPSRKVLNGETVELPQIEREGYALAGWEDEEGNLYTSLFVMPIRDVTLKANWKEKQAYAIYSASDTSLRFVRSAETIEPGDTYNGRVVTDVFTGFEEEVYASEHEVPWYDGNYYKSRVLTQVVFEDVIKPRSTAYWFYWAYNCASMDVQKLDMSNVTDMSYMCGWASSRADSFTITGINEWDVSNVTKMNYAFAFVGLNEPTMVLDLSKWDVSKVVSMNSTFKGMGYNSTTFSLGDLSKWDVSNVTDMGTMFMQTGFSAPWSLNLSKWNVSKVTNSDGFSLAVESKITEPNWKN